MAITGAFVCYSHGGAAPQVRRKAAERLADLIDPKRTLREVARLAYADPRELFDEHGNLRPIREWPDYLAAAIGKIKILKRNVDGTDGKTDTVYDVSFWDKPRMLEFLGKHLALLVEKKELTGDITIHVEKPWQTSPPALPGAPLTAATPRPTIDVTPRISPTKEDGSDPESEK